MFTLFFGCPINQDGSCDSVNGCNDLITLVNMLLAGKPCHVSGSVLASKIVGGMIGQYVLQFLLYGTEFWTVMLQSPDRPFLQEFLFILLLNDSTIFHFYSSQNSRH